MEQPMTCYDSRRISLHAHYASPLVTVTPGSRPSSPYLLDSYATYSQPPQDKRASSPTTEYRRSICLDGNLAIVVPQLGTCSSCSSTASSKNSKNNNLPRVSRKRSRGGMKALSITPDPHSFDSDQHSEDVEDYVPSCSPTMDIPHSMSARQDTSHLSSLIGALILTNALAVMAGIDAKDECLKHETNTLLALRESSSGRNNKGNDDGPQEAAAAADDEILAYADAYDEAYLKEAENGCIRLFQRVMLPAMLATAMAGLLGLMLLRNPSSSAPLPPMDAYRNSWRLMVVVTVVLIAQAYNVTYIMLSPRISDSSENPFRSLAAVDLLGHVSDNANLYYLTWLSVGIAVSLFYQTVTATNRAYRAAQVYIRNSALLPATSWYILSDTCEESRNAWYQSLYRLRVRTGIWTAALLTCLVITASSQFIWKEVLWPHHYYTNAQGDDDAQAQIQQQLEKSSMETLRALNFSVCHNIYINSGFSIPVAMCRRTAMAWMAGILAMILCAIAIGIHWVNRNTAATGPPTPSHVSNDHNTNVFRSMLERHRAPLGAELILSIVVSVILGYNAVFATGLHGPAANVGNLYYASWLAFLLLVRICLGCLEEWYQVDDKENPPSTQFSEPKKQPTGLAYLAPALSMAYEDDDDDASSKFEKPDTNKNPRNNPSEDSDMSTSSRLIDQHEKDRAKRLRTYFCLSIFSTVCASSAYDAACNEDQPLNSVQRYIVLAPAIVALISLVLFILCLSKRCYLVASHFCVGGILAVISFGLWMADLVLTMHSEESWAVNRIGEIKMANLYYFSWASILTAGFQLSTYVKALLGITKNDTMSIVWIGICKVCFVMFGAGMHIWLNISNKCDIAQLTGAVTFCSRTVLAIVVSLTSMFVGGLVITIRFFQAISGDSCHSHRIQAHIEIVLSLFLVFLFATALALITGIGGPGQSVGDLYYSTWLAFVTSLGIFLHCYDQITREEDKVRAPPVGLRPNPQSALV